MTAKRRPKVWRDNDEILSFIQRLLRAYRNRDGLDVLEGLDELRRDLEAATYDAVTRLRSEEGGAHSWADIGQALGISRQSAQERFRKAGGVRSPGGQPARWR